MKKGCFIKSIIILTIVVASAAYLIQFKFKDFFFEPGKKILASWFTNEFSNDIRFVVQNPQKDSLNLLVRNYIESVTDFKDYSEKPLNDFLLVINSTISDSIVTSAELDKIKNLIQKRIPQ